MATRAARPCRSPACPELSRDGSGYCEAHAALAMPASRKGSRHERGYGSAWEKLRSYVLHRDNGLCQPCKRAGRLTRASEVDHMVPKVQGGTDATDNLQAICEACHLAKSRGESGSPIGAKRLPIIARPPACRVVLVCGCAGAGKSSYVREHCQTCDVVIDLDVIRSELAGVPVHQAPSGDLDLLGRAMRERNARLFRLAAAPPTITAWFIAGAPTRHERAHWRAQLRAEVVVLETTPPEAYYRIEHDPARAGKAATMRQWIAAWWDAYTPDAADRVVRC